MSDPVSQAIEILNDALQRDPEAIIKLVNLRVGCNVQLANHPTIQTSIYHGIAKIGVLGLINGIGGNSPSGAIGAEGSIRRDTGQFTMIRRFIDLRDDKTDVIV